MQTLKGLLNNRIVKAGSWYTVTNFLIKGITFLTIPIFTSLLTTAEYGLTNIYLSWVNIVAILLSFELYTILGRAKSDLKEEYDEFHSSAMFFSIIVLVIFVVISVVLEDILLNITGLSRFLFYLMIGHSYGYLLQQYLISKYRFDYNYKKVSLVNIFLTGIGISLSIVFILTLFSNNRVEGKLIGQVTPIIIIGAYTLVSFLRKGNFKVNFQHWKYIIVMGGPLILHAVSRVLNNQFDRILIDRFVGSSEAGIYSFVYNIGTILQVILISLNQAWVPWFYEKMEENNRRIIRIAAKGYRDLFILIFAGILFLSPEIMRVMAGDDSFLTSTTISIALWILMAIYFQFMYNLECYVGIFHKRTSLVSIASMVAAVINVGLNIIFIPIYGETAAAITTAIAFFIMFLMHYFMASKVIGDEVFGIKFHLVSIMKLSIISIGFYTMSDYFFIRLILVAIYALYEIKGIYKIYIQYFKK